MIYEENYRKGYVRLKCEDCGEIREVTRNATIAKKKEHPCRSCSNVRNGIAKRGRPSWNSGKTFEPKKVGSKYQDAYGYMQMWVGVEESEAYGRVGGYVLEHRKVMQDHLGRKLKRGELIHHINGDTTNNSIENLFLCENMSHHKKLHAKIEDVAFQLMSMGYIVFNRDTEEYKIAPSVSND